MKAGAVVAIDLDRDSRDNRVRRQLSTVLAMTGRPIYRAKRRHNIEAKNTPSRLFGQCRLPSWPHVS
jgi:hypothetical protein